MTRLISAFDWVLLRGRFGSQQISYYIQHTFEVIVNLISGILQFPIYHFCLQYSPNNSGATRLSKFRRPIKINSFSFFFFLVKEIVSNFINKMRLMLKVHCTLELYKEHTYEETKNQHTHTNISTRLTPPYVLIISTKNLASKRAKSTPSPSPERTVITHTMNREKEKKCKDIDKVQTTTRKI